MKYLKYFESKSSIDAICKKYGIRNYTINEDGTVDVDGNVDIHNRGYDRGLEKIPLKFGYVSGDFYCSFNQLTTLEGSPNKVGGNFICSNSQLTTLEGASNWVGGDFDCSFNKLTSLEGSPNRVDGSFFCQFNKLITLLGAPEELGLYFHCYNNQSLPKEILDNMDYIDKIVKYQYDYNIWRRDGSLDKYRFSDMMKEIMEEETNI
jgi:hypothetical protein